MAVLHFVGGICKGSLHCVKHSSISPHLSVEANPHRCISRVLFSPQNHLDPFQTKLISASLNPYRLLGRHLYYLGSIVLQASLNLVLHGLILQSTSDAVADPEIFKGGLILFKKKKKMKFSQKEMGLDHWDSPHPICPLRCERMA